MSRFKKTKKLFYDKYIYKVSLQCHIASEFRGNNIRNTIDNLQNDFLSMKELGESQRTFGSRWNSKVIKIDDLERALILARMAADLNDYHFRVEGSILSFYTNSDPTVNQIVDLYENTYCIREIWRPENDKIKTFLLSNPKKIIRPEYSHKYKVTINGLKDPDNFKEWAKQLPKLKIMPRNNYQVGGYFYVSDEKTLSLCRIFLGDRIRRVDELRTLDEI